MIYAFNFIAQLTYINVLHWTVEVYYYGFLGDIGLILSVVIQRLCSTLSIKTPCENSYCSTNYFIAL